MAFATFLSISSFKTLAGNPALEPRTLDVTIVSIKHQGLVHVSSSTGVARAYGNNDSRGFEPPLSCQKVRVYVCLSTAMCSYIDTFAARIHDLGTWAQRAVSLWEYAPRLHEQKLG